jgi:hypothetical protein
VIISKYATTYDTSDGSEQHFEDPARPVQSAGQAARERWEDDGGPLGDQPRDFLVGELTSKPAWSVLSLRDLNAAIRREEQTDDPVRLQQEFDRAERWRIQAVEVHKNKLAASARAKRDRYGNAWEHALM